MNIQDVRLECLKIASLLWKEETAIVRAAKEFENFLLRDREPPSGEEEVKTLHAEKKAPPAKEEPKAEEQKVTYEDVKKYVLEVAKKLGRNGSLDLLAPFGVVSGEGDERKGNMSNLKEEQYAAVIIKAKEMLK